MSDLPRELPGARERDDALGLDALDAIRKQIADHVDKTQGTWAQSPLWKRTLPLAIAIACAASYAAYMATQGAVGMSAALAWAASIGAFFAVGRAPLHPSSSEWIGRASLAGGALALACEIGFTYFAAPHEGATDFFCARAVVVGALVPCALLALYVKNSQAPARLFHVAALAGAAFLASSAAVWSACPSTIPAHVLLTHVGVPVVAAVVVAMIVRPMLRGSPVPAPASSTSSTTKAT